MHLGVEIKALGEGMTLRQPQLTCCVIELLHLVDVNPKSMPVVKPLRSKKSTTNKMKTTFIVAQKLDLYHVYPDSHGRTCPWQFIKLRNFQVIQDEITTMLLIA